MSGYLYTITCCPGTNIDIYKDHEVECPICLSVFVAGDRNGDGWAEVAGLSAKADQDKIATGLTARRRLARAA